MANKSLFASMTSRLPRANAVNEAGDALVRKPGEFADHRYREEMFPSSYFRFAYDLLGKQHSEKVPDATYLQILKLAVDESQQAVDDVLRVCVSVFVAHSKSKMPAQVNREKWFKDDKPFYGRHREGIGAALSTIRRSAEASALRMLLTEAMKGNDNPVVVLGDLNDDKRSNKLNIISGQPNYLLSGLTQGGSDVDLYSAGTLQEYRSERDVYYTHVHQNSRESLDHILVSQEFYDNSKKRVWAFLGSEVMNDHLSREDHKESGTTDHGIVKATFEFRTAKT
jgi:hypothetical protein